MTYFEFLDAMAKSNNTTPQQIEASMQEALDYSEIKCSVPEFVAEISIGIKKLSQ